MDYTLYSAEDFAADESFISYHLKNDGDAISFWENWKIHHPEKLDEIYNAERLLDLMTLELCEEEIAFEYNRLEQFLAGEHHPETLVPAKKSFGVFTLVVTCLAFAALIVAGLWFTAQQKEKIASEIITKSNPFGQRSIIVLSDGTKVTLNANSTIRFPKVFAEDKRVLNLTGEAFFEVTKNKHQPFLVKTGQITTTVLGTKFNVNAHLKNSAIQIALVEGKVNVSEDKKNGQVLLSPLQVVVFDTKKERFFKSDFSERELTAWKDGVLLFKNSSFNDVAQKIYNTYGITLVSDHKKTNWSYTGEFYNRDYLTVIKSICYAKNLKYRLANDTVTIN